MAPEVKSRGGRAAPGEDVLRRESYRTRSHTQEKLIVPGVVSRRSRSWQESYPGEVVTRNEIGKSKRKRNCTTAVCAHNCAEEH